MTPPGAPERAAGPDKDPIRWAHRWKCSCASGVSKECTGLRADLAQAVQAETGRIETLIRKRLVSGSQRAVSWHEIQDLLEALRARPAEGRGQE